MQWSLPRSLGPIAGDLVVYSARTAHGRVVSFQMEMGSHGGLHHEEQTAFLLAPLRVAIDPDSLVNVRAIYPLFRSYHQRP